MMHSPPPQTFTASDTLPDPEGWHLPPGCKKKHFFCGTRSLCKTRRLVKVSPLELEPYYQHNHKYCQICLRTFQQSFHTGLHADRAEVLKRERAFAEEWRKRQLADHQLERILGHGNVSARDARIAATVIQWLGSNIGQEFLQSVARQSTADITTASKSEPVHEVQGLLFQDEKAIV